jgi:hypothetical protein
MPQKEMVRLALGNAECNILSKNKPKASTYKNKIKMSIPITIFMAMLLPVFFDLQKDFNS